MAQPLRVLLVEDDPRDADLIVLALRRDGFEPDCRRVDTKADYLRDLNSDWDVIMADYSLPGFGGIEALELLKETGLEIPFMLVSGTIGEETAVEAMKFGASDYLLKDRLARLGAAVRGVLEQSHRRKQHKQALEALQRTSRTLQTIFDSAPVAILGLDLQGKIVRWNAGAFRMFGWTEGEVIGRICPTVPEENHADYLAMIAEVIRTGGQTGLIARRLTKNGEMLHTRIVAAGLRDTTGETIGVMTIIEDITKQRQAEEALRQSEEQLRQSQKMEAIGQLSSGVAHDFNNLLTVIKGHLDLFQIKGQISPTMINSVQQINHAADRASTLTRQLLMFSRQQVMHQEEHNLNGLVANLGKMLGRLLPEKIMIEVNCATRPMMISADEGMVEQVLLNLAINARDAMADGGSLLISTQPVDFTKTAAARIPQAREGKFVCLQLSDSGAGIPAETLPRIFEPFFTTKEIGKGTGLGLAMVYGIMQQHNGWITVESKLGEGTTFRAYFPRLHTTTLTPFEEKSKTALPGGHEGILLVEDEASVRQIAEAALVSLGYRVFSAVNGKAGLQVWDLHKQSVDLVITDLIMPEGVDGAELATLLLAQNPQMPVLFMSGYRNEVATQALRLEEGVNYLSKPFDLTGLAKIVRAMLDRAAVAEELLNP
ncbi:MAG: response regulator [Lacunisphaera sp.]